MEKIPLEIVIPIYNEGEKVVNGSYKAISRDLKHNSPVRLDED